MENTEEQLVSFETAKLAKEEGFQWQCNHIYPEFDYNDGATKLNYFQGDGNGYTTNKAIQKESDYLDDDTCCTAPTQSFLQKWLRDVHNIYIVVTHTFSFCDDDLKKAKNMKPSFTYNGEMGNRNNKYYNTYEECLEVALFTEMKRILQ